MVGVGYRVEEVHEMAGEVQVRLRLLSEGPTGNQPVALGSYPVDGSLASPRYNASMETKLTC